MKYYRGEVKRGFGYMWKFTPGASFRFLVGLLLIPCNIALTRTVMACVGAAAASSLAGGARPFLAITAGLAAAAFVFWALPAPLRLYVLGHELTHALWGALLGARVSGMGVSRSGGYVKLSQSNWLIALAPYFFPLYTFIVILAYYVLLIFFDLRPYFLAWLGLIGFTFGFHIVFTVYALAQDQQDVRNYGRLFALGVIYLINMLGVCLVLLITAPLTLAGMLRQAGADQAFVWSACVRALAAAATWARGRIGPV